MRISALTAITRAERAEVYLRQYFFDVDDGRHRFRDVIGKKLIDRHSAVVAARVLLRSLSQIEAFQGRPGSTYVRVREAGGRQVYEGSTHLEG